MSDHQKLEEARRLFNLGVAAGLELRWAIAKEHFLQAHCLMPERVSVLENLAKTLACLGQWQECATYLDRLRSRDPENINLFRVDGLRSAAQGNYGEALRSYEAVIKRGNGCAEDFHNLGRANVYLGYFTTAIGCFRQALLIDSDHIDSHINLAHCLLHNGEWLEGWREYEYRLKVDNTRDSRTHLSPEIMSLSGGLEGKRILFLREQGLGDAIQFVRFVSYFEHRGAKCIVECPRGLLTLFTENFPSIEFSETRGILADYVCPLMSMPYLMGQNFQFAYSAPYIRACDAALDTNMIKAQSRIGLVWRGNPKHANDVNRSIGLAQLTPLLATGLGFLSLQQNHTEEELSLLKEFPNVLIVDRLNDFSQTANFLSPLSLLISVDTSVAHLGAAMGKRVYLLLPYVADWRWGASNEHTPWYPTMQIFRQTETRSWAPVIETIQNSLGCFSS
jgi:hypothetical protein